MPRRLSCLRSNRPATAERERWANVQRLKSNTRYFRWNVGPSSRERDRRGTLNRVVAGKWHEPRITEWNGTNAGMDGQRRSREDSREPIAFNEVNLNAREGDFKVRAEIFAPVAFRRPS